MIQLCWNWHFSLLGLFVGPLCIMQSHRWTCSVGIVLMSSGAFLSAFAETETDIYLSVGLIAGNFHIL